MKVASFNVNGLRARLPIIVKWLKENDPDILCVQETKVQDHEFPTEPFDKINYQYTFRGQKSYNGVAIFSKHDISNVSFGYEDEPKDEARLIKAQILGINIVNTYIPQGQSVESERFTYKINFFKRLRKYFENNFKPEDPILWFGDFNIAREDIDVYDPQGMLDHVCYHHDVHKVLAKIMDWGFIDTFRLHCDQAGQYSFWDYRMNAFRRNLGWRLDFIMATKPLVEKCTKCYIDKEPRKAERPSDHTPVIAEFSW
ncbi:MAG: exodeoxyribonuclease III [Planctomycetota bacterium]|jgi:exodeoxyribonuclease-3